MIFKDMRLKLTVERLFKISLILKGLNGLAEILGGLSLFFIKPELASRLIIFLTRFELEEDPTDKIANYLVYLSEHWSTSWQIFGSFYLLSHGIIKLFLIMALLRRKLWSYPVAGVVFFLFIIYQLYRVWIHFSWGLIALSVFDAIIIILIWLEYRKLKSDIKNLE